MNIQEAQKEAKSLNHARVKRSDVQSFINKLANSKLMSEQTADMYSDILAADRTNGYLIASQIVKHLK